MQDRGPVRITLIEIWSTVTVNQKRASPETAETAESDPVADDTSEPTFKIDAAVGSPATRLMPAECRVTIAFDS